MVRALHRWFSGVRQHIFFQTLAQSAPPNSRSKTKEKRREIGFRDTGHHQTAGVSGDRLQSNSPGEPALEWCNYSRMTTSTYCRWRQRSRRRRAPKKRWKKLSFDLRFKKINLLRLSAGSGQQKPKPMASFRLPATTLTWESHQHIYVYFITGCQLGMDSLKCKSHRLPAGYS